jgi:cholest-4-en-3-one 26-monooxygenase
VALPGIDLLDMDRFVRGEHHEMFRRLRAEDPVYWHDEPKGPGFWSVTKHADLVAVNRDATLFSSEVGGISIFDYGDREGTSGGLDPRGLMMLYTDPPKHTRYRLLVNKGFTPRMIGLLEQYLTHRATLIVDNVIERGECDFVEDLSAELPLQAIADIMGVPQEDRRLLFEWSNKMIGVDDPEYQTEDNGTAAMELYAYVNALAKARQSDPRDDIVTKLINAEIDGDKLSEVEFDMFMLLLTVAGNETTRNTTSWGMHALLNNPDQLAYLQEDVDGRLDTAIEEILRWASPVLHFRRTATADTQIGDKAIKAGDKVVIWHISANRDEDVFADPFRFDVSRDPNDHIAFGGGGPHFCLGAHLARREITILFEELLARTSRIELLDEPRYSVLGIGNPILVSIGQMPVRLKAA